MTTPQTDADAALTVLEPNGDWALPAPRPEPKQAERTQIAAAMLRTIVTFRVLALAAHTERMVA